MGELWRRSRTVGLCEGSVCIMALSTPTRAGDSPTERQHSAAVWQNVVYTLSEVQRQAALSQQVPVASTRRQLQLTGHLQQRDPQTEDVCRFVKGPSQKLWSHVLGIPFHSTGQTLLQRYTQTKVPQLPRHSVMSQEDVCRLDVKMAEAVVMEMLQTLKQTTRPSTLDIRSIMYSTLTRSCSTDHTLYSGMRP